MIYYVWPGLKTCALNVTYGQTARQDIISSHLAITSISHGGLLSLFQSSVTEVRGPLLLAPLSLSSRKGQKLLKAVGSQQTGPAAKLQATVTKPRAGLTIRFVTTSMPLKQQTRHGVRFWIFFLEVYFSRMYSGLLLLLSAILQFCFVCFTDSEIWV